MGSVRIGGSRWCSAIATVQHVDWWPSRLVGVLALAACSSSDGDSTSGDSAAVLSPATRRRRHTGDTTAGGSSDTALLIARGHGHQLARPVACVLRHVPDLHDRRLRDADRSRQGQHDARAAPGHQVGGQRRADRVHVHARPEGEVRRRLARHQCRREVVVGAPRRRCRARRRTWSAASRPSTRPTPAPWWSRCRSPTRRSSPR